jgi:Flp pilus assembly protein TadB
MDGLLLFAIGALGLSIALIVFVIVRTVLGRRTKLHRRIREVNNFTSRAAEAQAAQEGSSIVRAALAVSERAVERRGARDRIAESLDRAAVNMEPHEWMLLRAVAAGLGGLVLAFLLPFLVGLILGAVVGWVLPGLFLRFKVRRRARRFADLLPEALQLAVSALRSGFSLPQAIDALVREGPEPVAGEFGRAVAEIRLGGELEDALERTAARNNSRDLAWLVMAIRIQREVGGNLSEVLETAVETMRERGRVARHVRALSAEGRMSAYVLVGLPLVLGIYMFLVRRDYVRPLYTELIGMAMLASAVVMLALGTFWMSRVIKVEV